MEFNQKLQNLRKQKGLTQEELAKKLFVSRTAISKWESGRGYPNLVSLKDIAELFSVSIDELLSNSELLTLSEEDNKRIRLGYKSLLFGLIDFLTIILFFLPFFAQRTHLELAEVSLINLKEIAPSLKISYYASIISLVVWGVLEVVLKNNQNGVWEKLRYKVSIALSVLGVILFILTLQVYVAVLYFVFLIVKTLAFIK